MPASTFHDGDIEAQIQMDNPDSEPSPSKHSHVTSHEINEGGHYSAAEITRDKSRIDTSHSHHEAPPPTNAPPGQSGWKPLKADEPLFTKIPESKDMKETWVKAMGEADDGMCKGWKDQIDTLIIFAGLFSATVTAFTIESYQWLDETPANTLARLQLRGLLNTTHDPAMDHLAPAAFHVSSTSVAINTLWFASLTFSLAAVVISILCKQWLHEYQRYDNFTTDEAFLIRGLRHRGLQAWKVPQIILFLPILLQTALVLFLVGVLILLWSLQTVVATFTTLIIGATFVFLIVTTMLPSIQYIFPTFETQCAYKSSQSWSFFVISAFWFFDLNEFTNGGSIDQWEIYNIDNGMGRTLSWIHQSFRNNLNSFLYLYNILVDKSLKPTLNEDVVVLRDFIDELSPASSREGYDLKHAQRLSKKTNVYQRLGRVRQLRICHKFALHHISRQKSRFRDLGNLYGRPGGSNLIKILPISIYHPRMQSILHSFLQYAGNGVHQVLFNRSIEHWARGLEFKPKDSAPRGVAIDIDLPYSIFKETMPHEPEIAKWLIGLYTHLFQESLFPLGMINSFIGCSYPKLMECHNQCELDPSPVTLLKYMQEWINRAPEFTSGFTKFDYVRSVLVGFWLLNMTFESFVCYYTSDLEKEHLTSFIRFFVDFSETEDFQQPLDLDNHSRVKTLKVLAAFRQYLNENATVPPSNINQNDPSPQSPAKAVIENT